MQTDLIHFLLDHGVKRFEHRFSRDIGRINYLAENLHCLVLGPAHALHFESQIENFQVLGSFFANQLASLFEVALRLCDISRLQQCVGSAEVVFLEQTRLRSNVLGYVFNQRGNFLSQKNNVKVTLGICLVCNAVEPLYLTNHHVGTT